jgi:hypothetical protein
MMAGEELPECEVCNDKLLNTDVYRSYFNSMFAGPTTPLVNAQSPDSFEPMPSNFGGSIF